MELDDRRRLQEEEDDDPFLKFVDYARSVLAFEDEEDYDPNVNGTETNTPGWSWIASRVLRTCIAYSSSVTPAILLSELSQVPRIQTSRRFLLFRETLCNLTEKFKLIA